MLVKITGGDMFHRFKPMRPSTWLPEGEPPVELRKFTTRDGQIQLAVRHTDLARIERHMVDSGLASAAQVAQAWREFAASNGRLLPIYMGDLVSIDDDSLALRLDEMGKHNEPIVAAWKMAQAVAEASSTPNPSDLSDNPTLGPPPPSAPPSPSSPIVVDGSPALSVSHESSPAPSDLADPVELTDPLQDLDDALREADEVVAPGASRPSFKKDWVVHWGQRASSFPLALPQFVELDLTLAPTVARSRRGLQILHS